MSDEPRILKGEGEDFKSFKYVDDEKPGYWFGVSAQEEGPYENHAPVGTEIDLASYGPLNGIWYKVYDEGNECVATSFFDAGPPESSPPEWVTGPLPIDPPPGG